MELITTGKNGNLFQENILKGLESIIKNRLDPSYMVANPKTSSGITAAPATSGVAGIYTISFKDATLHLPNGGVSISIDAISLNYTVTYGDSMSLSVTSVSTSIGTDFNIPDSNTTVTWVGNIFTLSGYNNTTKTTLTRQISFDYTLLQNNPISFTMGLMTGLPSNGYNWYGNSPLGVNFIANNNSGTPLLNSTISSFSGYVPITHAIVTNTTSTNNPKSFSKSLNFGIFENDAYDVKYDYGTVEIVFTGYADPAPEAFYVPGETISLFCPDGGAPGQTEIPSTELLRLFLLKDNSLTDGDTTAENANLTSNPEALKLIDYISRQAYPVIRTASNTICDDIDESLCSYDPDGRIKSFTKNCIFTLNVIVM